MPGNFIVKSSQSDFLTGEFRAEFTDALPQGLVSHTSNWMELNHFWPDLTPVDRASYRVVFSNGTQREGELDAQGYARIESIPTSVAAVYFGEDKREWKPTAVKALTVTDEAIAKDARMLGIDSDEDIAELIKAAAFRITGSRA